MINFLAHVTPVEAPAGVLLFVAGFFAGALVMRLAGRFRTR